jgi:hypothetical protein
LEKDLEGSGRDLTDVLSQHFPGKTEEKSLNPQSGYTNQHMPAFLFKQEKWAIIECAKSVNGVEL